MARERCRVSQSSNCAQSTSRNSGVESAGEESQLAINSSLSQCAGSVQPGEATIVSRRGIYDREIWKKPLAACLHQTVLSAYFRSEGGPLHDNSRCPIASPPFPCSNAGQIIAWV